MNNRFKLSVPSKTFICGEYAVLADPAGPALVANTKPCFEVTLLFDNGVFEHQLPPNSPFLTLLYNDSTCRIEWNDPHQGRGGFGGSGAEFIACLLAHNPDALQTYQTYEWLEKYIEIVGNKTSGVDILSQLTGQIAYIDKKDKRTIAYSWPFESIGFSIIRTGEKLNTTDGIYQVSKEALEDLRKGSIQCIEAFRKKHTKSFIGSINQYRNLLYTHSLCTPTSNKIQRKLNESDLFLAIKGCGAMGAETIVVFYDPLKKTHVLTYLEKLGLEIIADDTQLESLSWSPL